MKTESLIALFAALAMAAPVLAADAPGRTPTQEEEQRAGSIQSIDLTSTPPMLRVSRPDGTGWTVALDRRATAITQAGKVCKLEQLKIGQEVTVTTGVENGREIAKSIRVEKEA